MNFFIKYVLLKGFKLNRVFKNLYVLFIVFSVILIILLMLISESYPASLKSYFFDFNLLAKQIFIPEEMVEIRYSKESASLALNDLSADLDSVRKQRNVLSNEVFTLNQLLISEAYNVKPSKVQLLEQALAEEKLLAENKEKPPGFKQL